MEGRRGKAGSETFKKTERERTKKIKKESRSGLKIKQIKEDRETKAKTDDLQPVKRLRN